MRMWRIGYYEVFPPKSMNVSVENKLISETGGNQIRKKVLVVNKDFAQGETIYKVWHFQICAIFIHL